MMADRSAAAVATNLRDLVGRKITFQERMLFRLYYTGPAAVAAYFLRRVPVWMTQGFGAALLGITACILYPVAAVAALTVFAVQLMDRTLDRAITKLERMTGTTSRPWDRRPGDPVDIRKNERAMRAARKAGLFS